MFRFRLGKLLLMGRVLCRTSYRLRVGLRPLLRAAIRRCVIRLGVVMSTVGAVSLKS